MSYDTYASNKQLVDELIDTSLYRGGTPVRQHADYFEDGGTFNTTSSSPSPSTTPGASSQELILAVQRVEDAVRALPSRVHAIVDWNQSDTLVLEQDLNALASDRN